MTIRDFIRQNRDEIDRCINGVLYRYDGNGGRGTIPNPPPQRNDSVPPVGHTPGPWTYENDEDTLDQWLIKATETDNADVVACVPKTGDEVYDDHVTYRNARLIAAAPDLLKALDECITDDGAACIVQNDVAYMIRRFKAINRIARAAIANATYRPDYHDLDRVPYGC